MEASVKLTYFDMYSMSHKNVPLYFGL